MKTYFAVIPDGQIQPAAVFAELEDAIDWGVGKIGQNRFSIRGVQGAASDWAEGVVPAEEVPAN